MTLLDVTGCYVASYGDIWHHLALCGVFWRFCGVMCRHVAICVVMSPCVAFCGVMQRHVGLGGIM